VTRPSMTNATNLFRAAVVEGVGAAPDEIEPGRMMRFPTSQKRGDTSGWCRIFEHQRVGVYGCHRRGISGTWRNPSLRCESVAPRRPQGSALTQVRLVPQEDRAISWRRNADSISRLWSQSRPVERGDPAYIYLRSRLAADEIVVPTAVRFHPLMPYMHNGERVGAFPCLVAKLVSADGQVLALHRTYLNGQGGKATVPGPTKKLTRTCGILTGACIRLQAPAAGVLGIAEGIETALAASLASGVPSVAGYCARSLAVWQWPRGLRHLLVFADADQTGVDAAQALQSRAVRAGLATSVLVPSTAGTDWLDVWAGRHAVGEEKAA
jgi:hypothetical protein